MNSALPPNSDPSSVDYVSKLNLKSLEKIVPSTSMGIALVVASVLFTCFISICISCRKCKKRGKGKTGLVLAPNLKFKRGLV